MNGSLCVSKVSRWGSVSRLTLMNISGVMECESRPTAAEYGETTDHHTADTVFMLQTLHILVSTPRTWRVFSDGQKTVSCSHCSFGFKNNKCAQSHAFSIHQHYQRASMLDLHQQLHHVLFFFFFFSPAEDAAQAVHCNLSSEAGRIRDHSWLTLPRRCDE